MANETASQQVEFDIDEDIDEQDALAVATLFAFLQEIGENIGTVKRADGDEPYAKVVLL